MMDFARRLAPMHDGDASRAMAVLPSRFAGEREGAAALDSAADHGEPPWREAGATPQMAERSDASAPSRHDGLAPAQAAGAPAITTPRSAPSVKVRVDAGRQHEGPSATAPMASVAARASVAATPHEMPSSIATSAVPHTAELSGADAAPATPMRAIAAGAMPIAPTTRQPLSDAVLAARHAIEPSRPVVHVTIDRIDVRAPSTAAREAATPRPRQTASSVSLGDYLRQRSGASGGRR